MEQQTNTTKTRWNIIAAILVAALGYFVDIFDLLLFGIVRVDSLRDLGFSGDGLESNGYLLLNMQMAGMLIGGILWGILGDKKGRLQVLFGSILLYSLANIANGLVEDIGTYALCRFIAGIGLAGELGAGITLVSELMPKNKRGIGTTIVASIGLSGALVGGILRQSGLDWRTLYFIGGGLGLLLLVLRIGVSESGMYTSMERVNAIGRGKFLALFTDRKRLIKYLSCIALGFPTWYAIGILIFNADKMSEELGIVGGPADPAIAIPVAYAGLVIGDVVSGLISQLLRSRKKVLAIFFALHIVVVGLFFGLRGIGITSFYVLCFAVGFSVGYWVIFVTTAAEQFGTNIRATVTTTVPNFVRGAEVIMSSLYLFLFAEVVYDRIFSAILTGILFIGLALLGLLGIKESFSEDLDYIEEM